MGSCDGQGRVTQSARWEGEKLGNSRAAGA